MRALADAAALEHPDVSWTPPPRLPSIHDLNAAIAVLTPPPADARTMAACLAALVIAFEPNTKLSPDATRLRLEVWKQANGDLGNALWTEATERAIRGLKWMPKPSELRELVSADLTARAKKLEHCRRMLVALGGAATTEKPLATRLERLKHTRSIYDRMGDRREKVAELDAEIAREAQRP